MFPTIFSLASEALGRRAAEGSGIICVAIVGGAIVPLITGHAADLVGLQAALAVPAMCYAVILSFGIYARRPAYSNSFVNCARQARQEATWPMNRRTRRWAA